jgi:hypothetical protein
MKATMFSSAVCILMLGAVLLRPCPLRCVSDGVLAECVAGYEGHTCVSSTCDNACHITTNAQWKCNQTWPIGVCIGGTQPCSTSSAPCGFRDYYSDTLCHTLILHSSDDCTWDANCQVPPG